MGLTLIREWDGTVEIVKAKEGSIEYPDGTVHAVSAEYLNKLKRDLFPEIPKSKEEDSYW